MDVTPQTDAFLSEVANNYLIGSEVFDLAQQEIQRLMRDRELTIAKCHKFLKHNENSLSEMKLMSEEIDRRRVLHNVTKIYKLEKALGLEWGELR